MKLHRFSKRTKRSLFILSFLFSTKVEVGNTNLGIENENKWDNFAVAITMQDQNVGHILRNMT